MAKTKKMAGGYRLECANGGLAPACTECVACDVAQQVRRALDELRALATSNERSPSMIRAMIMPSVRKIEHAACGGRR